MGRFGTSAAGSMRSTRNLIQQVNDARAAAGAPAPAPRPRVAPPAPAVQPVMRSQVDAILAKIESFGEDSLTASERALLRRADMAGTVAEDAAPPVVRQVTDGEILPFAEVDGALVADDGVAIRMAEVDGDRVWIRADGRITDQDGRVIGDVSDNPQVASIFEGPSDLDNSAIDLGGPAATLRPNRAAEDKIGTLASRIRQATMDSDVSRLEGVAGLKQLQAAVSTLSPEDLQDLLSRSELSRYVSPQASDAVRAEAAAEAQRRLDTLAQMADRVRRDPSALVTDKITRNRALATPAPARQAAGADAERALADGMRDGLRSLIPDGDWNSLATEFNSLPADRRAAILDMLPENTRAFVVANLADGPDGTLSANAVARAVQSAQEARSDARAAMQGPSSAAPPVPVDSSFAEQRVSLTAGRLEADKRRLMVDYSDKIEAAPLADAKALVAERDRAIADIESVLRNRDALIDLARSQYLEEHNARLSGLWEVQQGARLDDDPAAYMESLRKWSVANMENASREASFDALRNPRFVTPSQQAASAAAEQSRLVDDAFSSLRRGFAATDPAYAQSVEAARLRTVTRSQPTVAASDSRAIDAGRPDNLPEQALPGVAGDRRAAQRSFEESRATAPVQLPPEMRPYETRLQAFGAEDPSALPIVARGDEAMGRLERRRRADRIESGEADRITEAAAAQQAVDDAQAALDAAKAESGIGALSLEDMKKAGVLTEQVAALEAAYDNLDAFARRDAPGDARLQRGSEEETLLGLMQASGSQARPRVGAALGRASTASGRDGFVDFSPAEGVQQILDDARFSSPTKNGRLGGGASMARRMMATDLLWSNRAGRQYNPIEVFGSADKAAEFQLSRDPYWASRTDTAGYQLERAMVADAIDMMYGNAEGSRPMMLREGDDAVVLEPAVTPTPAVAASDTLPASGVPTAAEVTDLTLRRVYDSIEGDKPPFEEWRKTAQVEVPEDAPTPEAQALEASATELGGETVAEQPAKPTRKGRRKKSAPASEEPAPEAAAAEPAEAAAGEAAVPASRGRGARRRAAAAESNAEAAPQEPAAGGEADIPESRGRGARRRTEWGKDGSAADPDAAARARKLAEEGPADAADGAPPEPPKDGSTPPDGADGAKPDDGAKKPAEKGNILWRNKGKVAAGAALAGGAYLLSGARRAGEQQRLAEQGGADGQDVFERFVGAPAGGVGGDGAARPIDPAARGGDGASEEAEISRLLNRLGRRSLPASYGIPGSYAPLAD